MPTVLRSNLHESSKDQRELPLFNESGELTIAGNVVADFLEHADFSELFEHPAAQPYVITLVDESDETVTEEVLPGAVVQRLVDEEDLTEMFLFYLDLLGENAQREEASLDDKAKLAVFENALLKPINERYKRGAFRAIRKQPGGGELVNRMLGAMIRKGEIKRAKTAGGGYKGGDYEKGGKYRTGPTKAVAAKAKLVRRRKGAKVKQSMQRTRRARARARALSASVGMEESFLFGFGETYSGAEFRVSPRKDVTEVAFTAPEFAALKAAVAPCYEGMKPKTTAEACSYDDEEAEKGDKGDDAEESAAGQPRGLMTEALIPTPVGTPTLAEGASIAAAAIGRGQTRKPLEESKKG